MRPRTYAFAALWSLLFALLLAACSKPEPPTIEPEGAVVKSVTPQGLDVEMTIDAYNPNSIPLIARSVKARVKLDGRIDLGEVEVPTEVKVPAKKHEKIVAPVSVKWQDASAVAIMAATRESVPFTIEGSANVGIDDVNFDIPFTTEGSLTRDQLMKMGMQNLPQFPKLPL